MRDTDTFQIRWSYPTESHHATLVLWSECRFWYSPLSWALRTPIQCISWTVSAVGPSRSRAGLSTVKPPPRYYHPSSQKTKHRVCHVSGDRPSCAPDPLPYVRPRRTRRGLVDIVNSPVHVVETRPVSLVRCLGNPHSQNRKPADDFGRLHPRYPLPLMGPHTLPLLVPSRLWSRRDPLCQTGSVEGGGENIRK